MGIDEFVLDFVKKTRYFTNDIDLSEAEQTRLKGMFDDVLSSVIKEPNNEEMPLALIICSTYNKYSVVMPARLKKGGLKYYILYDRHLTEINRLLDAIYLDDNESAHDIWKLSYELFAEEALLREDEVLTFYYGLNKVALGPFEVDITEQDNLDFIVEIQERYIMGHELGHWIFSMSEKKMAENNFNITFDADWVKFLDNLHTLLSELYDEYRKKFASKEYTDILNEQQAVVNENSKIQEECFADAIAYAMVFSDMELNYPDDLEQKLLAGKALLLQMMNLQLLAMQNMTVSEESFEIAVSIRLGFLRNYSMLYFEGAEEVFDRMLAETAVRYEERITNIMLECFSELEMRGDNIYDALVDSDGTMDMGKVLGIAELSKAYKIT